MSHSTNSGWSYKRRSGLLLSWGCGEFGQHGHNHHSDVSLADSELKFFIKRKAKIKHMACGACHSIIVTDDNEIYTWGNGNSGQLGNNDNKNYSLPQRIKFDVLLEPVTQAVDCGSRHTVVVTESGRVFTCGNNFDAQLGYDFRMGGYKQHQFKLHLLRSLQHQKVDHVACGSRHTLFLLRNGTLASCGSNANGQLGHTDVTDCVVPRVIEDLDFVRNIACGLSHSLAITSKGHVYVWGCGKALGRSKDVPRPRHLRLSRRIADIACGHMHSVLLSGSGHIFTFGNGTEGQLGHGEDTLSLSSPTELQFSCAIASVSAGECFNAAVSADGELYMWGKNVNLVISDEISATVWIPKHINMQERPIAKVVCGAWHVMALTGMPGWEAVQDSDITQGETDSDTFTDVSTPEPFNIVSQSHSISSARRTADCVQISEEIEATTDEEIAPEPLVLPSLAVACVDTPPHVSSPMKTTQETSRPASQVSHCASCARSQASTNRQPALSNRSKQIALRGHRVQTRLAAVPRPLLKTSNIDLMLHPGTLTTVVASPGIIPGQTESKLKRRFVSKKTQQTMSRPTGLLEMHGIRMETSLRDALGTTSMPSMSDTPVMNVEQKRPSTISSGETRRSVNVATPYMAKGLSQWSRHVSDSVNTNNLHTSSRRGGRSRPVGRDNWINRKHEGMWKQSSVHRNENKRRPIGVSLSGWTSSSFGKH